MHQVTALAEAAQIPQPVVGGVVVEMCGGEHDPAGVLPRHLLEVGPTRGSAAPVPPGATIRVEPAPVGQAAEGAPMRPATALAGAAPALEPHPPAQLPPMRRIERTQL